MFPRVTDRRGQQAGAMTADGEGPGAAGGPGVAQALARLSSATHGLPGSGGDSMSCPTVPAPRPVMGDPARK